MILPLFTQGSAGVVDHAGRSGVIGSQWWQQMCRLAFKTRFVITLVHPDFVSVVFGIFVFTELPVNPPAAVGTIDQIDKALVLAFMIAVVVYRDEVAVLIKDELVSIAQPMGEDLKV